MPSPGILRRFEARRAITTHLPSRFCAWASHNPSSKPRRSPCRIFQAAAVTLGMPPAELLDDTLYDIVNNDDTNTNEGKGASLVAALTSTLLARHIAGRCDPLKTKSSCRITMMATGANRYPQRGCIRFILHIRTCNFFLQLRDRCQRGSKGESSFRYPVRFTGNTNLLGIILSIVRRKNQDSILQFRKTTYYPVLLTVAVAVGAAAPDMVDVFVSAVFALILTEQARDIWDMWVEKPSSAWA